MLTRKQLDLLEFIHKRLQKDGVPPSFDEMKEAIGEKMIRIRNSISILTLLCVRLNLNLRG